MALSLPTQVAVVAGRCGGLPLTACRSSVAADFFGPSTDSFGGRCHTKGGAVCLQGPALKSRVSDVRQKDSLSSTTSLNSPYRAEQQQPVKQQQGIYRRQQRTGVPGNEAHPNPNTNSSALIDIEDSGDGCITFKYGAVEDLWDLDRLLEFLAGGTLRSRTAEYFVRVVVELFRVPVSSTGERRIVDLLASQIRFHSDVSPDEMEKTVSQVLAEATSEFLPPSSVGSYSKGSARPHKRFSSRLDKWWKQLDDYLGVGVGSVDFVPGHAFEGFGGYFMLSSGNYEKLNPRNSYKPFKPNFPEPVSTNTTTTEFIWMDRQSEMPWLARPSDRLYLQAPKTSTLELLRENDSSSRPGGPGEGEYVSGLDCIMFPSQVDSLEDVLRKTEVVESAPDSDLHFARPFSKLDTLPTASIQASVEWEQEEMPVTAAATLPSRSKSPVKTKAKKATTTQQTKGKKTNPRVRGSTSGTKSAAKKKSTAERRNGSQLCDMFFGLPISHKCSGVAGVLTMRENFGGEMLAVLNQAAVGFAGVGVAVTLHVVARMLSVNSTFDSSKLFGLIRGSALVVLSASMQSVRKVMLRLPAGCTVSDSKDKAELLCLQQRLRRLSFTAMTVMVLTVVGHGI